MLVYIVYKQKQEPQYMLVYIVNKQKQEPQYMLPTLFIGRNRNRNTC